MSNFRKVGLLGVGVLTPALIGHPKAEARSVDFASAVQTDAATAKAKQLLSRELFTRSPAEKLEIAGDRIRLSQNSAGPAKKSTRGSKVKGKGDVHKRARTESGCEAATTTNPIRCLRAKEKPGGAKR